MSLNYVYSSWLCHSKSGNLRCLFYVIKRLDFFFRDWIVFGRMGCMHSRRDMSDIHPNIYRVINIDDFGNGLWHGQIQVTELELILIRRNRDPTKWPLRSLRRYGFDGDIFSFEAGRRCPTGEGIYAFRCRRAEQLFTTLQQYIQVRNLSLETATLSLTTSASNGPATAVRPLPVRQVQRADSLPNESSQIILRDSVHDTIGSAEYLQPQSVSFTRNISRFTGAAIRLNSIDSGPISPGINSPGSPSSANILEVMPLNPLPEVGTNHLSNLYHLQEFPLREHNNNRKIRSQHSYTNTNNVDSDLVSLRSSLQARQNAASDEELEDIKMLQSSSKPSTAPLSPTLSYSSEHYATLVEQDPLRLYMNIITNENITDNKRAAYQNTQSLEILSKHIYTNDARYIETYKVVDEERHSYANLSVKEVSYDPKMLGRQISNNAKCFIFVNADMHQSASEQPPKKMNYAILDLPPPKNDPGEGTSQTLPSSQTLPPPPSPKKPGIGYTTIDFNKTIALQAVATCTEIDSDDGSRRTRHNSSALPVPGTSGV